VEKKDVEFGTEKPTNREKKKLNELRIKKVLICLIDDNMLKNLVLFLLQVGENMKKLEAMRKLKKKLKNYFRKLSHFKLPNPKDYYNELFKLLQMKVILC